MADLYYITLDPLGSFKTADGRFEAICWTHRGGGWDVIDHHDRVTYGGRVTHSRHWYAPNARTARQLVRTLLSGGDPYTLDRVI